MCALHFACYYGHVNVMKSLFEKGAQVHAKDSNGWTALFHASRSGCKSAIQFLIEKGANANEMGSIMMKIQANFFPAKNIFLHIPE